MKTDIDIAQSAVIRPITEVAKKMGLTEDDLELYGKYKAKLPLSLIDDKKAAKAKLILVTAITPTPAGEGKTTTSIGLAQGMNLLGKKTTVVLREPSLGAGLWYQGWCRRRWIFPGHTYGGYQPPFYGRPVGSGKSP